MAGGKTYQVTQVDPLNPHTKGMVYQVNIVGGGTQMEELPEASADNVGQVYQYLGETGSGLTHGFFYESQALGTNPETYGWVAVNVQQGGATNSATTDLSNLTATGTNIANWSSNVSNCIINIPQDINLTLSNGTLTLKAGSKVYVPNGSGVFDVVTISEDKTYQVSANGQITVYYSPSQSNIKSYYSSADVSGTTPPATYGTWYDTANNLISRYDGGAVTLSGLSFPIARVTVSNGAISSIDQIFNGFGYIGSTVFALPGVKGLIPNGRNADGSLNNILTTPATTVKTSTMTSGNTGRKTMTITSSGSVDRPGGLEYNERENRNYNFGSLSNQCICGYFTVGNDYKITDFVVKTAFHAVDYSDTEFIAHQAMPSSRHINLTLGASSTNYIAAADGYMFLNMTAGVAYGKIDMWNKTAGLRMTARASSVTGEWVYAFVPVSKGDEVNISYTTTGAVNEFYVVYANGAK